MLRDVDHFTRYNDRFGHHCGDAVLCKFGEILARHCRRAGDIAARYGGEEFAVPMPGIDAVESSEWPNAYGIASLSIRHSAREEPEHITISIGVTTFRSSTPRISRCIARSVPVAIGPNTAPPQPRPH